MSTISDLVTDVSVHLSEAFPGFSLGFMSAWALGEFGYIAFLGYCVVLSAFIRARSLDYDGEVLQNVIIAYVAFPLCSGYVAYLGDYEFAAYLLLVDYAVYFHSHTTPEFVTESASEDPQ